MFRGEPVVESKDPASGQACQRSCDGPMGPWRTAHIAAAVQIENNVVEIGFGTGVNPLSADTAFVHGFQRQTARMQEVQKTSIAEDAAGTPYDGRGISLVPMFHDQADHGIEQARTKAGRGRSRAWKTIANVFLFESLHAAIQPLRPCRPTILRCTPGPFCKLTAWECRVQGAGAKGE